MEDGLPIVSLMERRRGDERKGRKKKKRRMKEDRRQREDVSGEKRCSHGGRGGKRKRERESF